VIEIYVTEIYVIEIYVIEIYVIEIYVIEIYVIDSEIFRNIFLKTIKPCFQYKINIYSYIYTLSLKAISPLSHKFFIHN